MGDGSQSSSSPRRMMRSKKMQLSAEDLPTAPITPRLGLAQYRQSSSSRILEPIKKRITMSKPSMETLETPSMTCSTTDPGTLGMGEKEIAHYFSQPELPIHQSSNHASSSLQATHHSSHQEIIQRDGVLQLCSVTSSSTHKPGMTLSSSHHPTSTINGADKSTSPTIRHRHPSPTARNSPGHPHFSSGSSKSNINSHPLNRRSTSTHTTATTTPPSPVTLSPGGKHQFAKITKFSNTTSSPLVQSKVITSCDIKTPHMTPHDNRNSSSARRRRTSSNSHQTPHNSHSSRSNLNSSKHNIHSTVVKGLMQQTEGLLIHDDSEHGPSAASETKSTGQQQQNQRRRSSVHSKIPKMYQHARRCEWSKVSEELEQHPRDAQYVGEKDGTTVLHLAVMSRCNPLMRDGELGQFKPAPLDLIEDLMEACPEAAIIRCHVKKYTPLSYACLVSDRNYDMDDGAEMVKIILYYAPQCAYVFTDDGFSALDVHILSYSRCHQEQEEVYSGGRSSTVVLRTLLAERPDLAIARVYKNKVRGPLELLYRCNTHEFMEAVDEDDDHHHHNENEDTTKKNEKARKQKLRCASVASMLSEWWAWKWALVLLKFSVLDVNNHDGRPFSPLHAAARLVGCPLPILTLAYESTPSAISERDPRNDLYNLPLHDVCSWESDQEIMSGDPFVVARKAKAISFLLKEYPQAARMTNNMGETPLQLAIETCTAWHGGLEQLVLMCPKALRFPRRVRRLPDVNAPPLSIPNHHYDQQESDSEEDEDEDEDDENVPSFYRKGTLKAVDGMYPFLVAAALSHIPEHRRHPPPHLYNEEDAARKEYEEQLHKKDLQSCRSIYGLLRHRAEVLELYRQQPLPSATSQQQGSGRSGPRTCR
jgi:hypothetical protein